MTSHDVRDMLDLPDAASRPVKKQKLAASRQPLKGLAREVQNLGGDNPIAIVPETTKFKKRRLQSRSELVAKWELQPFKNSARTDDSLVLKHWRRKPISQQAVEVGGVGALQNNLPEKVEDSAFAKFNVQINILDYSDEEYSSRLVSQDWTKDETDYLIKLIREFDLRWPIIWDRYEYGKPLPDAVIINPPVGALIVPPRVRTMEEMKSRYYYIAATMMAIRKPPIKMNSAEFNLHEVMLNFNSAQEIERKKYAEASFKRSKEEAREEESLLLELKRIIARSEKLGEERRELYARLETPPSTANIGIYTSSAGLQQLLQQLMSVDKSKKQRKTLTNGDGVSPASGPSGQNQPASFDRRESTVREPTVGSSSSHNNKKGSTAGPTERRQLTEEEERIYGVSRHERIGTSGPAFRHEKINKPLQSKSAVQQAKFTNILIELGITNRLTMPTAAVGEAYDGLLHSINALLEARKLADKLTGEISVEKAKKAERERLAAAEKGDGGATTAVGDGAMATAMAMAAPGAGGEVKREEREKSVTGGGSASAAAGGGSAGGTMHKRSASVLSTVSDKSAKRQKK